MSVAQLRPEMTKKAEEEIRTAYTLASFWRDEAERSEIIGRRRARQNFLFGIVIGATLLLCSLVWPL